MKPKASKFVVTALTVERSCRPDSKAGECGSIFLLAIDAMAYADPCRLAVIRIFRGGMIQSACS